ncbi:ribonucleoside hydrolase RihC [Staphylococcus pasteuri]|uniref:ribonucleoside hydrolase RihC n=1 Tax=Staphylococcus pasteuri TaxID=45972 RepID=UPI0036C4F68F
MVIPIIIDTDPGIDDAAAISLALSHPNIEVKMISTVNGNVNVDKTTNNALKLVHFFDSKVPVYKGTARPLISDPVDAAEVHGESGMDGYVFESFENHHIPQTNSIEAIKDEIMKSSYPITIVAIGPLTNIALLLATYPEVKSNIKQIVIMGGSSGRGNVTPLAEFNIYCDPEAANIVFNAQIPVVMIGLDLARKAMFSHDFIKEIKQVNQTGNMLYHLLQHYRTENVHEGIKLYDVFTILYLINPDIFNVYDAYVQIELHGLLTKGATVVDFESLEPNCKVVHSPISTHYQDLFLNALSYCK